MRIGVLSQSVGAVQLYLESGFTPHLEILTGEADAGGSVQTLVQPGPSRLRQGGSDVLMLKET